MAKGKTGKKKPAARPKRAAPATHVGNEPRLSDDSLDGPPPREATVLRSDREREAERVEAAYTSTSPELSGGDPDADWQHADSIGEEAVGGTVATPDQSVVDDLGDALGVHRAPDEPLRTSSEILEQRDRHRWEQEG